MNWFDKLQDTFLEDDRYLWLLEGLGNTLLITLGALLIGVIIGGIIAIAKYFAEGNKKLRIVNWICDLYTLPSTRPNPRVRSRNGGKPPPTIPSPSFKTPPPSSWNPTTANGTPTPPEIAIWFGYGIERQAPKPTAT